MRRLFLYGTLRPSGRLNRYYDLKNPSEDIEVKGFSMVDVGHKSYPIAFKDEESSVVGNIMETSEEEFKRIASMEMAAGYTVGTVTINDEELPIFIQDIDSTQVPKEKKIKNWLEYVRN
jgi:gamma-glutamylcyclotransferase (GGCT)/AIG2-like uncharacterized protein YtfP